MPGAFDSPTSCTASAVELAGTSSTSVSFSAKNRRHWARAWGIDTTRRTSASSIPGGPSRFICTGRVTSRWINSSCSKIRLSRVRLTVPVRAGFASGGCTGREAWPSGMYWHVPAAAAGAASEDEGRVAR